MPNAVNTTPPTKAPATKYANTAAGYMDPSTGTFTSMDTHGGSLSDSMSLHKYLFANANPVKYSDPSGHSALTEQLLVCALIGELSSSILYYVELFSTDSIQYENPEDYIFGGVKAAITGLIMGVFICLFYMTFSYITTAYIATVIFGTSELFMAGFGMIEGAEDVLSGDTALGWTKIVMNAIAAAFCFFSLVNGTIAENKTNSSNSNNQGDNSGNSGNGGNGRNCGNVETGGDGENRIRVGRWMSKKEYGEMVKTGKVQQSSNNKQGTHVSCPADPNSFKGHSADAVYVEFEVDSSRLANAGRSDWEIVTAPGSYVDRLNQARGGAPYTGMPKAYNIVILGGD